jgi:hypothetical protein
LILELNPGYAVAMTDSTNSTLPAVTSTDPAQNSTATGTNQANPLDALEAILQQAKAQATTGNEKTDSTAVPSSAAPDPAILAAQEEARKIVELETMQAANKIQDEASLKAELANLSQVSDSAEEKARVQQNADSQQAQTDRQTTDEYVIHQLGHTKI